MIYDKKHLQSYVLCEQKTKVQINFSTTRPSQISRCLGIRSSTPYSICIFSRALVSTQHDNCKTDWDFENRKKKSCWHDLDWSAKVKERHQLLSVFEEEAKRRRIIRQQSSGACGSQGKDYRHTVESRQCINLGVHVKMEELHRNNHTYNN